MITNIKRSHAHALHNETHRTIQEAKLKINQQYLNRRILQRRFFFFKKKKLNDNTTKYRTNENGVFLI